MQYTLRTLRTTFHYAHTYATARQILPRLPTSAHVYIFWNITTNDMYNQVDIMHQEKQQMFINYTRDELMAMINEIKSRRQK